jgi:hypothetical protein
MKDEGYPLQRHPNSCNASILNPYKKWRCRRHRSTWERHLSRAQRVCRIFLLFALEIVCMLQVFARVRLPTSQKTLYINNTKMLSSLAFESMLLVREDTPDLLVLEHPPVITHLYWSKRKACTPFILAPPITPKRRRLTKKAWKLQNSSSPALVISSPYR